jgi:hypothetical protein
MHVRRRIIRLACGRADGCQAPLNDGRAREEAQQIDEMAAFADDPPTTDLGDLRPVPRGNRTGIDGHDEGFGTRHALQQRLHAHDLRGEAAVESHHQQRALRPGCFLQHRLDRLDLGDRYP